MKNKEPTRVREHGTHVTLPKRPDERIAAVRQVVERRQYAKVDGIMLDTFSANAIVKVFDAIADEKVKEKFAALPINRMASIAFNFVK